MTCFQEDFELGRTRVWFIQPTWLTSTQRPPQFGSYDLLDGTICQLDYATPYLYREVGGSTLYSMIFFSMGKEEYKGENECEQWRVLVIWEGEGWLILWVLLNQIVANNSFMTWKMAYMMVDFIY